MDSKEKKNLLSRINDRKDKIEKQEKDLKQQRKRKPIKPVLNEDYEYDNIDDLTSENEEEIDYTQYDD